MRFVICHLLAVFCLAAVRAAQAFVPANLSPLAQQPFLYPHVPPMPGPGVKLDPKMAEASMAPVEYSLNALPQTAIAPSKPPSFVLTWNVVQPNVDLYELWHSSNLVDWNILAATATNSIEIPETNLFVTQAQALQLATNADGSIATNIVCFPFTNNADFFMVRPVSLRGCFCGPESGPWATR